MIWRILTAALAAFITANGVMTSANLGVPSEPRWWVQVVGLSMLVFVLRKCRTVREAMQLGLTFAVIWLAQTYSWLYVAMHTYGGLPSILSIGAVIALSVVLGSYYAVAATFAWRFSNLGTAWGSTVFAVAWTVAEMARGTWFTGFGWGAVGYAHVDGPLSTFAPWLGVYGVGAVAAWIAAALAHGRRIGMGVGMALGVILLTGWLGPKLNDEWTQSSGALTVELLQGNIAQDEKFEVGTGVRDALDWYGRQLQTAQGDLVVAPETAIPVLPQQLPDGYWDDLRKRFASGRQAALIGIPLGSYERGYSNSVIGLVPGSPDVRQYDKHHLVPFGEFTPPWFKWFTALMHIPLGDFNRGVVGQPSIAWKGQLLAPNICYEDLFGEELGARFIATDHAPNIFVNVSNLAWFGDTFAIDQHLAISRMRAMEFQRPFIRATNTGATAIVDFRGTVVAEHPRQTRGVLHGVVEGRSGITPYAWWVSRFGLWPLWCVAVLVLGVAWRRGP